MNTSAQSFSIANTLLALGLLSCIHVVAMADEKLDRDIASLQLEWAKANYQIFDKDAEEQAFKTLAETADKVSASHPAAAEAMIWQAIILSSYANAKGGLGALKLAEKARDLLLAAEKINPSALQGSAYATLGTLYYKVPGWPVGFGDKAKARAYLEKSLQINPGGMDANYFYGDYWSEQGEYAKAMGYYKKALAAPARPGREDEDAGRKQDVEAGMQRAEKKL